MPENTSAPKSPINTHVRLFDLVRYARATLHEDGLITDGEYAWLSGAELAQGPGSPSPRRLEDYDDLRAELEKLKVELATRWTKEVQVHYEEIERDHGILGVKYNNACAELAAWKAAFGSEKLESAVADHKRILGLAQRDYAAKEELKQLVEALHPKVVELTRQRDESRAQVVWCFSEDLEPVYIQGSKGEHEICACAPVTAEEMTALRRYAKEQEAIKNVEKKKLRAALEKNFTLQEELKRRDEISAAFHVHEKLEQPPAEKRFLQMIMEVCPEAVICSTTHHGIRVMCEQHKKLQDQLDLARDEFKRIEALLHSATDATMIEEILQLCERSRTKIERNITVIAELDRLADKVHQLESFEADIVAGCDIDKGEQGLYRQKKVERGGRTMDEMERDQLLARMEMIRKELETFKREHWPEIAQLLAARNHDVPENMAYPACLTAITQLT